jgi:glycosyltransferase involved in cell wall biosynthesis
VPPNKPDELAATMIELLKDAPLRQRMGQAGRAFVECKYALESVLEQWSRMYETVLDQTCVMV